MDTGCEFRAASLLKLRSDVGTMGRNRTTSCQSPDRPLFLTIPVVPKFQKKYERCLGEVLRMNDSKLLVAYRRSLHMAPVGKRVTARLA